MRRNINREGERARESTCARAGVRPDQSVEAFFEKKS